MTSQVLANVYLHELDLFIKHVLKEKNYIRYSDDLAFVSDDIFQILTLVPVIEEFLQKNLKLNLHPGKVVLKTFRQGVDVLGQVLFPEHRLMRTKTRRRLLKRIGKSIDNYRLGRIDSLQAQQSIQSYLGMLSHVNQRQVAYVLINLLHLLIR